MPASAEQIRLTFAPIVRAAAPAVVNIYTHRLRGPSPLEGLFADPFFRRFFEGFGGLQRPRQAPEQSLGSGVIVDADGLIVTNHHVIEDADEIVVVLSDRREFAAEVLGADEPSDLALLRVDTGGEPLPALAMGDSDRLEVGDLVLAIGNPFGIGQTVTSGIVSAIARTTPDLGSGLSFIQTDAAINPGNSGGALITIDGRLVGINTAIFTRSGGSIGIGFAIPINLVKALVRAVEGGEDRLQRPWLGAEVQPVDRDLAQALRMRRPAGVAIKRLHADGPASRAGLKVGDVLLALDGVEIVDERGLNFRLAVGAPGAEVEAKVWRDGREVPLLLPLELPPYNPPPEVTRLRGRHALAGATVANLSPGFNRDVGLDPFEEGVVVLRIDRGSAADRLRLRRGDLVRAIGDRQVTTVDELRAALVRRPLPWRLEIEREGRRLAVVISG